MSNIVGEGFPEEIIKQIDQRQKVYGSVNRTNEELSYLEARTGWVKLVSSVDLVDPNIRGGFGVGGSNLAQEYVLFNGTTNESPDKGKQETYQRFGVWDGLGTIDGTPVSNTSNYYAYGMGGTDYGLRPMPGIKSASIKTETRGSIKTAEIKIQANNRQQFDIIDLLYMRLGFTMLLEWGNSSYFDNNGNYITDNPYSLADDFLLGKISYETYNQTIQEKRLASCGNYDAIIGKVVNFNWTFTKDLTYEITVKLISMGDVIESLKTNAVFPGGSLNKTEEEKKSPPQPTSETVIKDFANAHKIGKIFYENQQLLSAKPASDNGIALLTDSDLEYSGRDSGDSVAFFKQVYEGSLGTQYYVKFGWFLKWIEKNLIYNIDTGDANINKQIKILTINNKVKENVIYLLGRQLSTNPGICIFNMTFKTPSGFRQFASGTDVFDAPSVNGNRYGYIMNAYFNLTFILNQLEALKNSEGKVPLFDLLKSLCDGWNKATGNFSKLEPIVDTETNEIKILDQVILPNKDSFLNGLGKSTKLANFNVQGYYFDNKGTSTGGFIRDLSFQTTVSPNLATMITVGATSKGYVVGQDATALSRMNNGLVDRFKPDITTPDTNKNDTPSSGSLQKDYKEQIDAFNVFLNELGSYNGKTKPKTNWEALKSFQNAASTFYEYDQAKQTQAATETNKNAASPNSGFLPFDLSITIDGLSGMKIYQKYIIDTSYLPSNYPTSLEFIIKGITNTIESNQWTTTLESMAIPKDPFGSSIGDGPVEQASRNENRGINPSAKPSPLPQKRSIVDKIIKTAKKYGINDKNRITCILAVAYAETRISNISESFVYSADRFRQIFGGYRRRTNSGILKLIKNWTNEELTPYLTSQEKSCNLIYGGLYNNGPNEGWKYRGRGFTQVTFKSNYESFQKKLSAYSIQTNIVQDPDSITRDEDLAVEMLVIGKIEGQFGKKLNAQTDYINIPANILLTQNGGKRSRLVPLQEYDLGRQWVNNTLWVQETLKQNNIF
jgi:putative chitinase